MDVAGVLAGIGPRLRLARAAAGMSLAQVAAVTGLSVSVLSRVEAGVRRPTLDVLLPLAELFGMDIGALVGAPGTGDPRVHLPVLSRDGVTVLPLSRRAGGVRAYKLVLPGSWPHQSARPQTHQGWQWLHVLDGHLRVHLGDQAELLGPGEAAEFDTRTPHLVTNADATPTEIVFLRGPQGERPRLKLRRPAGHQN